MTDEITRGEALELIKDSSKKEHLINVGKIMKMLANYFEKDENEWELVGILHDLDFDITTENKTYHGIIGAEMLTEKLPNNALDAIRSHDYRARYEPKDLLAKMLICADALENFIEILENNKLEITKQNMRNKITNWDMEKPWLKQLIKNCEENKIPLDDFLEIGYRLRRI